MYSEQEMLALKPDKCPDPAALQIKNYERLTMTTLEAKDAMDIVKMHVLGAYIMGTYETNEIWQLQVLNKNDVFSYNKFGYQNGLDSSSNGILYSYMVDTLSGLQLTNSIYYNTPHLEKAAQFPDNFRWVCHYLAKDTANTVVNAFYPRYY
jgi:hypothetical protein